MFPTESNCRNCRRNLCAEMTSVGISSSARFTYGFAGVLLSEQDERLSDENAGSFRYAKAINSKC